jgi:hypothetical protein
MVETGNEFKEQHGCPLFIGGIIITDVFAARGLMVPLAPAKPEAERGIPTLHMPSPSQTMLLGDTLGAYRFARYVGKVNSSEASFHLLSFSFR